MSAVVIVKLLKLFSNFISRVSVSITLGHDYTELIFINSVGVVFIELLHDVSDISVVRFLA